MLKADRGADVNSTESASARLERLWKAQGFIDVSLEGIGRWQIRDLESLRSILPLLERLEAIAQIRAGMDSIERGQGIPMDAAFEALRTKHGIPDRA